MLIRQCSQSQVLNCSIKSSGRESENNQFGWKFEEQTGQMEKRDEGCCTGDVWGKGNTKGVSQTTQQRKVAEKEVYKWLSPKKKKKRWTVENRALNLEWTNSVLFILHFGITKLKSVTGSKTLTLNKGFNVKQYYETKLEGSLHSNLKWSSKGCWLVLGPLGGRQLLFWQS